MSKISVGKRKYLVENLLLLDGITRSGKFLLANIISSFSNIEPVQYYGLLEHIPFFEKFGLMDKDTSKELLQCEIDFHCYETLIGRNLNHRKTDKSSIYHNPQSQSYIQRSGEKNIDLLLKNFHNKKPYSFFITHEILPHINIYLEAFPKIKIIVIERNAIDLVYSWWRRGIGTRIGNDPIMFQIPLRNNNGPAAPWYAQSWGKKYHSLSEVDRIIFSIKTLKELYQKAYRKLTSEQRKKILFIDYDNLLINPDKVTEAISSFLQLKKSSTEIKNVLKKEHLPNSGSIKTRSARTEELRTVASKKYLLYLLKLEKENASLEKFYNF
ncbi:MAG: sulfotransferase domain-containing protein [bacterium]|nr:sulfotransferase domain-containing protein [bacterium]